IPSRRGNRISSRSRARRRRPAPSRPAARSTRAAPTSSRTAATWSRRSSAPARAAASPATSTRSSRERTRAERRRRRLPRARRARARGGGGESGCGKSTLARAAVGLVATSGGTVTFEGREVTPLRRRARPADLVRLQLVFQNPYSSLNPRRTVGSQVVDGSPGVDVAELLELVGLPQNAARRFPHEFSGGQRQRIAIARALAARPSVVVLDEPLASLDASAQAQLANLLKRLSRDLDVGLLLISHDLAIVRHVADRVSVMYLGRMVETALTGPLWDRPAHPYS